MHSNCLSSSIANSDRDCTALGAGPLQLFSIRLGGRGSEQLAVSMIYRAGAIARK